MKISTHIHPAAAAGFAGAMLAFVMLLTPAYAASKASSDAAQQVEGGRDESVSFAQAQSDRALREWLAALDINGDGILDETELAAAENPPAGYEMEVKQ